MKYRGVPNALNRVIFVTIITALGFAATIDSTGHQTFGMLPIVSRHVITEENPNPNYKVQIATVAKKYPYLPLDIKAVSYFSDGKYLNATLWLASPIYQHLLDGKVIRYGMGIYINSKDHPDYVMYISRDKNGTWTKNIIETDPVDITESKTESNIIAANHVDFFKDGEKYIDLSLNLNDIALANVYRFFFFTWTDAMKFRDYAYTTLISAIPSSITNHLNIEWPSRLILHPGNQTITIRVNSSQILSGVIGERDKLSISALSIEPQNITLKADPIDLPHNTTVVPIQLHIGVPSSSKAGNYTLNIKLKKDEVRSSFSPTSLDLGTEKVYTEILLPTSNSLEQKNLLGSSVNLVYYSVLIIPTFTLIPYLLSSRRLTNHLHLNSSTSSKVQLFLDHILKKDTLIQTNATIIVGVLILLTLNAASGKVGISQISFITASIVFPFALSAIATIFGKDKLGTRLMMAGFAYLVIAMAVIVLLLNSIIRSY